MSTLKDIKDVTETPICGWTKREVVTQKFKKDPKGVSIILRKIPNRTILKTKNKDVHERKWKKPTNLIQ